MTKTLDEMVFVGSLRDFILFNVNTLALPKEVEAETTLGVLVVSAPDASILMKVLHMVRTVADGNGVFTVHLIGETKFALWSVTAP